MIYEVDLKHLRELHDSHSDYPLSTENTITVFQSTLSNYYDRIRQKYNIKFGQVKMLVSTLSAKNKACPSLRKPSIVYGLGIEIEESRLSVTIQVSFVKAIHRFQYREKNAAKTLLVKDFYTRINNSIFGKTMENIRRTVDVVFITDEKKLS